MPPIIAMAFDVGGTSTDVSLVYGGKPLFTSSRLVADYPVKTPMIDIHVIGAGGGSLAEVDQRGLLRVGQLLVAARGVPQHRHPNAAGRHLVHVDGVTGVGGEVALPVHQVGLATDQRQAIQHLHAVVGGHHAAQVAAVVAVNAVDEAAESGCWRGFGYHSAKWDFDSAARVIIQFQQSVDAGRTVH